MSVANALFDHLVEGPEGSVILSVADIAEIDKTIADPAAIMAKLDHAIKTRPGLQVSITDTPAGGLHIRWRTR